MTFGKIIAWNPETQRGIIEDRTGDTFTVSRKDFVADVEFVAEGLEVAFENVDGTRETYSVESLSGQFSRFNEAFGDTIV